MVSRSDVSRSLSPSTSGNSENKEKGREDQVRVKARDWEKGGREGE